MYIDNKDVSNGIWRSSEVFPEYESFLVSSLSGFRGKDGTTTKGWMRGAYLSINVRCNITKKHKSQQVHRLVIACFNGRNDELIVNHKNGTKTDNKLENLEYVTKSQNVIHAIETGLNPVATRNFKCTKVRQLTLDGKIINEFNSIKDAHEYLGKNYGGGCAISAAVRRKLYHAYGFKWEKVI